MFLTSFVVNFTLRLSTVDEIDGYLYYLGGTVGAITIAGIAAASAYYFMTRPIPEKPLVPLENQSPILEVSIYIYMCIYVRICVYIRNFIYFQ